MPTITRENITYTVAEVPNTLSGFKNWQFTSGPVIDEDFRVFARKYKQFVITHVPTDTKLVSFHRGHYEVSGFVERQGKFVYFSVSDVRFFPGEWYNNILVRTAQSDKDYTGGRNCYTSLENFTDSIDKLLQQ